MGGSSTIPTLISVRCANAGIALAAPMSSTAIASFLNGVFMLLPSLP
jgi:hypothetical protein